MTGETIAMIKALQNKSIEELKTSGGSSDAGKVLTVGSDGKITPTNLPVGEGEIAVDGSLSVSGAAADAKKTGDAISALNGSLGNLEDGFQIHSDVSATWESGYIRDNGTQGADSKYCCTSNYVATTGNLAITLAPNHSAKVIIFDNNYKVVEIIRDITKSTVFYNTDGYFKAQIRKDPASEITPDYVTNDIIAFSDFKYADVDYIKGQTAKLKTAYIQICIN